MIRSYITINYTLTNFFKVLVLSMSKFYKLKKLWQNKILTKSYSILFHIFTILSINKYVFFFKYFFIYFAIFILRLRYDSFFLFSVIFKNSDQTKYWILIDSYLFLIVSDFFWIVWKCTIYHKYKFCKQINKTEMLSSLRSSLAKAVSLVFYV